jgi:hypothetical protein
MLQAQLNPAPKVRKNRFKCSATAGYSQGPEAGHLPGDHPRGLAHPGEDQARSGLSQGPPERRDRRQSFDGSQSVALILKRCVGHAGFAPEEFSEHSLRAGFATSAAAAGANERDMMKRTGTSRPVHAHQCMLPITPQFSIA